VDGLRLPEESSCDAVSSRQQDVEFVQARTCCGPCWWASISFSCATIFASSSRLNASGKPTKSAEVVTTQTMFPTSTPPRLMTVAVLDNLEEMEWRVEGGMMSTSAARRSKTVSSADSSEEMEESDSADDVRDDEDEA
jgi:hypothetical protein